MIAKAPIPHEENISHILVQSDVYFVHVPAAESKEGVPVDVNMLFTIAITNPYKARYRVQNWLEAVSNQAEAEVRTFVASEKVLQLLTVTAGDTEGVAAVAVSAASKKELEDMLADRLKRFKEDYGVTVILPQIQSVELAGPDAEKYRSLVTAEFEAQKNKQIKVINTDATVYEIENLATARQKEAQLVFTTLAAIPGGAEMYHSQQVGGLKNLTTYVEGDPRRATPSLVIAAK